MPSELVQLTSPSHKTPNTEKVQHSGHGCASSNTLFQDTPSHIR